MHHIKPELHWCGRILGNDVYVDTNNPKQRDFVEQVLTKALERLDAPTKQEQDND
jgi:hypothetical protein